VTDVWRRDEVESPCVKICVVHPATGLCIGCHRTVEEIAGWSAMTAEARRAVMAELPSRAARAKPTRRGGRAARRERE
jgi:hypothetical protein